MGYELLNTVVELLRAAGLRAGEVYPAGEQVEILSPAAAVGLRSLDSRAGCAVVQVRLLSPRLLGGWCCQCTAAKAEAVLTEAGMRCESGEMEYLSGTDCFCILLTVEADVLPEGETVVPGQRWQVLCAGAVLEGVESFRAVRDQGRRVVGAFFQSEPVAVTPGNGGWEITLVRLLRGTEEEPEEPFELELRQPGMTVRYTGCCWNMTELEHTQRGLRVTRKGFALGREVSDG